MLGQHKRDITVVPYQSGWKDRFEQEADLLCSALGEKALQIEHIGSTSIPGVDSKPIIDMMIAVESLTQASELIPVLESLGYEHRAHDIIPERMFFVKESAPEHRTHHLNLAQRDSGFWKNQIAFRDYLRTHDKIAAEYVALKKHLAEVYAQTNHLDPEGKTEFVLRVLEMAQEEQR